MALWQQFIAVTNLGIYTGAWWGVVDVTMRQRLDPCWSFVVVAYLSFAVPIMVSDLTFRTPVLQICLVGTWFVFPFASLIVVAWFGRLEFLANTMKRRAK